MNFATWSDIFDESEIKSDYEQQENNSSQA